MAKIEGHRLLESRKIFAAAMGFALIPAILASWAGLLVMQQQRFPIIDDFKVEKASINADGNITIAGTFNKIYPDWACRFRNLRWYMPDLRVDGRELRLRVPATYADKRANDVDNNRYSGLNRYKGWTVQISDYPDLTTFSGYAEHTCLGFFPARTKLPLMTIPPNTVTFRFPSNDVLLVVTPR